MSENASQNTPLQIFSATHEWEGATCLNRHDEFCPKEEIMIDPNWVKVTAPTVAVECFSCPLFAQCRDFLVEQMNDEEVPTVGVMAGVVLMQKSNAQIQKGIERAEYFNEMVRAGKPLPPSAYPHIYVEGENGVPRRRRVPHGNSRQARTNPVK